MTVHDPVADRRNAAHRPMNPPRRRPTGLLRLACAGLLGVAAALLVSCASSGKGLIPTGYAGPLQSDFEAVAHAAENGDGSCTATAEAIRKTEQDFNSLPVSVNAGLRGTLARGITNLRSRALSLCAQPLAPTTTAASPPPTTATTPTVTPTTPTVTQTTSTQTTPTITTPTTSSPGGGTPAPTPEVSPGSGEGAQGGAGEDGGGAKGRDGGNGGTGGAGGQGPGQEGGK